MPKFAPTSWRVQVAIFEADGFTLTGTKGSHMAFTRDGCSRPVIISKDDELSVMVIQSNMRTAGMSLARYFELLNQCQ